MAEVGFSLKEILVDDAVCSLHDEHGEADVSGNLPSHYCLRSSFLTTNVAQKGSCTLQAS